jgi:serine/threonine-protein kinase
MSEGGPSDNPEARIGQTLQGKWSIDRLLGVGGMGAVYEATHRNGRRVAIKVLHARYALDRDIRRRFLREGYVANKIEHPGAVAILDDDVLPDGSSFLVMELLDGESFSSRLSREGGQLDYAETLAVAGQIVEVLGVAHDNGIVHRDIKPANVFLTRTGHVKLLDFGLARIRDGVSSGIPTLEGVVMGTAAYMAPEQARGRQELIDGRTDLFSVGAVIFRAVTGRRIHEQNTAFDMTIAAAKVHAPSLAHVLPNAGPAFVAAVDRALAFEPSDRWQTAREMFEALRAAYEELRVRPMAPPKPAGKASMRSVHFGVTEVSRAPSLVVDVAFGDAHDEALSLERKRTREVVQALSSVSVAIDPDTTRRE